MNNVFQDIVSKIGKKGKELKQLLWNDEVLEENISESWLKMENEIFQNYDIKPDYVRKLINELKQES